jgi:NAD(P)-dependent dehydrogenase (short-subunit alcohol dehydrogenase family)
MNLELASKLALVSGSTAGIGFAIAELLLREGARVIVNGRTQEGVDAALAKLAVHGGAALGFAGDLSQAESAAALACQHPNVEILVNNLGIYETKRFEAITDADWQRFFDVNVLSGVRLARLYLEGMRQRNWGRIVFISSESGVHIPVEMIHYGMTKSAQIAVARGLAESVAGTGITVNSILPGPTRSRGLTEAVTRIAQSSGRSVEQVETDFIQKARPTSLIKRLATTEEVASLVAYIVSPLASATTGAALRVDGGTVKSAF